MRQLLLPARFLWKFIYCITIHDGFGINGCDIDKEDTPVCVEPLHVMLQLPLPLYTVTSNLSPTVKIMPVLTGDGPVGERLAE